MGRLMGPLLLVVILTCLHFTTVVSTSADITAGVAISKLLQERISKKFKEAANEVKGVLVRHLGDSLKKAHGRMNPKKKAKRIAKMIKAGGKVVSGYDGIRLPSQSRIPIMEGNKRTEPCREECRSKKLSHRAKCYACKTHIVRSSHQGAASHQNQAGRHRKNSGGPPPGAIAPPKPNAQQQMGPFGMPMPGPQGPSGPAGPAGPPGQPGAMQRPGAAPQCGGTCPASCAPTCDNTCCQMAVQPAPAGGCPSPCLMSCFSYCPTQCCQHKKNKIPITLKTDSDSDDEE